MTKRFDLKDDDGVTHNYEITPFGAKKQLKIYGQLTKILGEVLKTINLDEIDQDSLLDMNISGLIGSVEVIGQNMMMVADNGLIDTLFDATFRDGNHLGNGKWDVVYSSNHVELFEALKQVVMLNLGKSLRAKLASGLSARKAIPELRK